MIKDITENGPYRQTAINALVSRGNQLIHDGRRLLSLARALEDIEKSATQETNGDGRHPYIGVGSDAEEALWALVMSYKG